MFVDFRKLGNGAEINANLCVIGAGAAGIAIAREFGGTSLKICVVESGGFEPEEETQNLYQGTNIGVPYGDLDALRVRMIGGTTYHWGGWCTPMNELDFEQRNWVPHSGWPFPRSELDPYYERAQPLCDLDRFTYGEAIWDKFGLTPPKFDRQKILSRFWQFSPPTRFAEKFESELATSENVTVYHHCNVINLQSTPDASSLRYLDVSSLEGVKGRVTADHFILACGGLENPRLMLVSNEIEPAGVGNRQDLVGRYFMEHPHASIAGYVSEDWSALLDTYGYHGKMDVPYRPGLCPSQKLQTGEKILNSSVTLDYVPHPESGMEAAKKIFHGMKTGTVPDDLGKKLMHVLSDLDDVGRATYKRFKDGDAPVPNAQSVFFYTRSEQAPNPNSRVLLSRDRDALGLNRIQLDWRLTELDRRTLRVFAQTLGAELGKLNLGRVRPEDWLSGTGEWGVDLKGGPHHMGTTRMSDNPKQGVVDRDCRVHGFGNFYITGSSVFPTCGYANPTLTILALALRLADHLKQKLI